MRTSFLSAALLAALAFVDASDVHARAPTTSVKSTVKTTVKSTVKSTAKSTAKTTIKTSAKTTVAATTTKAVPTVCTAAYAPCTTFRDGADTCVDVWGCLAAKGTPVLSNYAIASSDTSTKDSIELNTVSKGGEDLDVTVRIRSITGWSAGSVSARCSMNGIGTTFNLRPGVATAGSDRTACILTPGASLEFNSPNAIVKLRSVVLCTTSRPMPAGAGPSRKRTVYTPDSTNVELTKRQQCPNWSFAPSCAAQSGCVDVVACMATGVETIRIGSASYGIKQSTSPTTFETLQLFSASGNRRVRIRSAVCRLNETVSAYPVAGKVGKVPCVAGQTTNIGLEVAVGTTQETQGLVWTGAPWALTLHSLIVCPV